VKFQFDDVVDPLVKPSRLVCVTQDKEKSFVADKRNQFHRNMRSSLTSCLRPVDCTCDSQASDLKTSLTADDDCPRDPSQPHWPTWPEVVFTNVSSGHGLAGHMTRRPVTVVTSVNLLTRELSAICAVMGQRVT